MSFGASVYYTVINKLKDEQYRNAHWSTNYILFTLFEKGEKQACINALYELLSEVNDYELRNKALVILKEYKDCSQVERVIPLIENNGRINDNAVSLLKYTHSTDIISPLIEAFRKNIHDFENDFKQMSCRTGILMVLSNVLLKNEAISSESVHVLAEFLQQFQGYTHFTKEDQLNIFSILNNLTNKSAEHIPVEKTIILEDMKNKYSKKLSETSLPDNPDLDRW